MTNIYVDYNALETGALNFQGHHNTLTEVLSQLESDLGPMINTWSGEARDLYLQKKAAWDKAAADLTALLASIAKITDEALTTYSQNVASLIETWA